MPDREMNVSLDALKTLSENDDHFIQSLSFLFAIFFCGAILQFMASMFHIGLPYTVVVFVLGMLVGISNTHMISVGPHLMLNAFMPILIFEGAFAMDVYVLRKVFWQALFLAAPGLVVITGLTAVVAQTLIKNDDWGWKQSVLFGSILSATDPVAVVALLKELGASPFLSLLIEGESLLNDGTAMVGFTVMYDALISQKELDAVRDVLINGFMRFAVGGPLFGYFMARSCVFWLTRTFNEPLSEIAATFTAAFLTFFIAEHMLHVSGVLALVVLGVVLSNNRTSISPEVETFLHSFWEVLAYLANTLIFFLVGMIVMQLVLDEQTSVTVWDFVYNLLIYVSINSIRALVIITFSPLLKRIGYRLPWQFTIVASWSGLRGAVGLALSLMVYETDGYLIPKKTVSYKVFFHLCGIVFLTLVINATTISKILDLLGMSVVSNARRAAMATALSFLAEMKHKTMSVWKTDRFMSDVDWGLVDSLCTLREPWDLTQDEDEEKIMRVWATCPQCTELVPYQPTTKEMADMMSEAILRLLKAEKLSYWRQFEHGMLSTQAVRILHELCENAADVKGQFLDTEAIKHTWQDATLTKVVNCAKELDISKFKDDSITLGSQEVASNVLVRSDSLPLIDETANQFTGKRPTRQQLLTRRGFVVTVAVLLYFVLDTPINVILLYVELSLRGSERFSPTLCLASQITSIIVWFLMVTYSLIRLKVLKKAYLCTVWFWLSLVISLTGLLDIIFFFSKSDHTTSHTSHLVLAAIRFIRQLHALEALVPLSIMILDNLKVKHLSNGYDVGRGFVMGEEEIRNRIDHMSDRRNIIESLRNHCDSAKMDILKSLGLLQKDNPEVAMGVKTRQAIRSVLNNLRDEVYALLQDGIIEEAEGNEMAGMVESRMKKLLTAPPKIPLPSTEKILQNVPWIADNEELVQFIKNRAKLSSYEYGDIIMHQDDPTTGISIILSGLVKLEIQTPVLSTDISVIEGEHKYSTRILDFLTSGNVLGEIGVLTDKPRSATVKCETGVQVLELSMKDVWDAFKEFEHMEPPLKYRLWRLSAIRLCTAIFLDQPAFQGMTKEKMRVRLENGYVEEVTETPNTYSVTPYIGEIVLLHGVAVDLITMERFIGPCYIPATSKILNFESRQEPCPAVFVLPSENIQPMVRHSMSLAQEAFGEDMGVMASSTFHQMYPSGMGLVPGPALELYKFSAGKGTVYTDQTKDLQDRRASFVPGKFRRGCSVNIFEKERNKPKTMSLNFRRSSSLHASKRNLPFGSLPGRINADRARSHSRALVSEPGPERQTSPSLMVDYKQTIRKRSRAHSLSATEEAGPEEISRQPSAISAGPSVHPSADRESNNNYSRFIDNTQLDTRASELASDTEVGRDDLAKITADTSPCRSAGESETETEQGRSITVQCVEPAEDKEVTMLPSIPRPASAHLVGHSRDEEGTTPQTTSGPGTTSVRRRPVSAGVDSFTSLDITPVDLPLRRSSDTAGEHGLCHQPLQQAQTEDNYYSTDSRENAANGGTDKTCTDDTKITMEEKKEEIQKQELCTPQKDEGVPMPQTDSDKDKDGSTKKTEQDNTKTSRQKSSKKRSGKKQLWNKKDETTQTRGEDESTQTSSWNYD